MSAKPAANLPAHDQAQPASWCLRALRAAVRFIWLPEEKAPHTVSAHVTQLLILSVLLIGPFVLHYEPNPDPVAPQGMSLGPLPLPDMCPSQSWFGTRCPGCGLTRSFVMLSRGDWLASYSFHRLGAVLYAFFLLQALYRIFALIRIRHPLPPWLLRAQTRLPLAMIVLLAGNWLWSLFVPGA